MRSRLGLDPAQMQTLVFLLLVFTTQANVYVLRTDGRIGSLAPSRVLVVASVSAVVIVSGMAASGTLMAAVPITLIGMLLVAVTVFAFVLDAIKGVVFRHSRLVER